MRTTKEPADGVAFARLSKTKKLNSKVKTRQSTVTEIFGRTGNGKI
jgi:hypothetical protein